MQKKQQAIWSRPLTLAEVQAFGQVNMMAHLGIVITEMGEDYLKATMPVDHRTTQPMGLLHGGASVVLAETLGSLAANFCVSECQYCVGLEINANHLRSVQQGLVTGTAQPVHLGRKTQVWQIHIHDEKSQLVCLSRLTLAVIDKEEATKAA